MRQETASRKWTWTAVNAVVLLYAFIPVFWIVSMSLKDAGTLRPEQVSFGKYHNVSAAMEVARSARTVLGANGITLEYPVLRHANNLESVLTYEGTHEMHTLILGQAITGVNAFT